MKLLGKKRKNGRPKTHQQTFSFRMPRGVHDYIKRQAEDLDITQSAFVLNAVYQYVGPHQMKLGLVPPDPNGEQTDMFASTPRAHV